MLNKNGQSIEPCGTPAIIFPQELKLLLHEHVVAYCLSNFSCKKVSLFQVRKPLIWQLISYGSMCQMPLNSP